MVRGITIQMLKAGRLSQRQAQRSNFGLSQRLWAGRLLQRQAERSKVGRVP